jgi:uncharacterized protein YoxC
MIRKISFFVFALMVTACANASVLKLSGTWRYEVQRDRNVVEIAGGSISNDAAKGESGSIKLRLFLMDDKYTDGNISGYVVGECEFEPLAAGYKFDSVDKVVNYVVPPSGSYYVTLALLEYEEGRYVIKDYLNFDGLITDNTSRLNALNAVTNSVNSLEGLNQSPNVNNGYFAQPAEDNSVKINRLMGEYNRLLMELKTNEDSYESAKRLASGITGTLWVNQCLQGVNATKQRIHAVVSELRELGQFVQDVY